MFKGRRRSDKKPIDVQSLTAAALAALSLLVFVLTFIHSVMVKGDNGTLLPGIGVLLMLVSAGALLSGLKERKSEAFNTWSRLLGVIVTSIALLFWLSLYLIGLFLI